MRRNECRVQEQAVRSSHLYPCLLHYSSVGTLWGGYDSVVCWDAGGNFPPYTVG